MLSFLYSTIPGFQIILLQAKFLKKKMANFAHIFDENCSKILTSSFAGVSGSFAFFFPILHKDSLRFFDAKEDILHGQLLPQNRRHFPPNFSYHGNEKPLYPGSYIINLNARHFLMKIESSTWCTCLEVSANF